MLRHFDEKGDEYMEMTEYANLVSRAPKTVRASICEGNRFRKLQAIREGTHLFVKKNEYYIYPYIASGKNATAVYHYDEGGNFVLCEQCTQGKRCPKIDDKGEYVGHAKWREIEKLLLEMKE